MKGREGDDVKTHPIVISQWNVWWIVFGLCLFIACLSFKPSEPYLTQYLVCNYNTQKSDCSDSYSGNPDECNSNPPCLWIPSSGSGGSCSVVPCSNVTYSDCGNSDYDYCETKGSDQCQDAHCYKHFSEDQVNNDIYPWSTYAYLPFLLVLGPFAEIVSYKYAILFGILGRVATRALLIYGNSLQEMQLMQVVYSLGTAAEDVFSAYVYYVVSIDHYQAATSYIKASALMACVLSGILGDILVVEWDASLLVLMWISAAFVWTGFFVGLFFIRNAHQVNQDEDVPRSKHSSMSHKTAISRGTANRGTPDHANYEQNFFKDSPFVHSSTGQHLQHLPAGEELGFFGAGGGNIATNLDRNRFVREVFEGQSHIKGGWKATVTVFKKQLLYLGIALKSNSFRMMLGLWILGNAIFSILYNYEVSIYEELAGSNNWNGSVLAIMLLCGSVGAMLPTWLHDRASPLDEHHADGRFGRNSEAQRLITGGVTVPDSEIVVAFRLIVASLIASGTLIWFIFAWSLIQSITALALFFACWQYINAIVFSRIAMYLKLAQIHVQLHGEEVTKTAANQKGASVINSGTLSTSTRARAATTASNGSLLQRDVTIGSVTSSVDMSMRSSSNILPGHLVMHGMTLTQPTQPPGTPQTPAATTGPNPTTNPVLPADYLLQVGVGTGGDTTTGDMDNSQYFSSIGSDGGGMYRDSEMAGQDGHYQKQHSRSRSQVGGDPSADEESLHELIDPPYSFAVVAVIAVNVAVQVILQSILFSSLQWSLRACCVLFVLIFIVTTVAFAIASIVYFGVQSMCQEGKLSLQKKTTLRGSLNSATGY